MYGVGIQTYVKYNGRIGSVNIVALFKKTIEGNMAGKYQGTAEEDIKNEGRQ
ncbi:MAG: hypothetical protein ACI9CD_001259 [Candidatus Deianiraeaceae bacterium]